MRKLLLATCALGAGLISPAWSQNLSSSASASASNTTSFARMAAPTLPQMPTLQGTTPYNGTTVTGEVVVVTQVNPGAKPGQMGVAVSFSGGYTTGTGINLAGQSFAGGSTISAGKALGMAFNGGSYNVQTNVASGLGGTTTSGSGGPGSSVLTGGSINITR